MAKTVSLTWKDRAEDVSLKCWSAYLPKNLGTIEAVLWKSSDVIELTYSGKDEYINSKWTFASNHGSQHAMQSFSGYSTNYMNKHPSEIFDAVIDRLLDDLRNNKKI